MTTQKLFCLRHNGRKTVISLKTKANLSQWTIRHKRRERQFSADFPIVNRTSSPTMIKMFFCPENYFAELPAQDATDDSFPTFALSIFFWIISSSEKFLLLGQPGVFSSSTILSLCLQFMCLPKLQIRDSLDSKDNVLAFPDWNTDEWVARNGHLVRPMWPSCIAPLRRWSGAVVSHQCHTL